LKYILMYPEVGGTADHLLDAGSIPELALAAEDAGLHGIALTEHPAPSLPWLETGHQSLDPFVALAAAAAVTKRISLVTNLSVVPYRNPLVLAKAAATLSLVSDGRFKLGAGTGYLKSEYFALGVDFEERNTLFDESLDVMKLHWSGEPFDYQGLHFSARNIIARPRPLEGRVPLWIGGNSKKALERVAAHGDGWMPMMASQFAKTARTPPIETHDDLHERLGALEELMGNRFGELDLIMSYHGEGFDEFWKEPERHREGIAELEAMGATWIYVSPPWSHSPAPAEWVAQFGAEFLG
jgi:probable F420-dependent oxidoreductase